MRSDASIQATSRGPPWMRTTMIEVLVAVATVCSNQDIRAVFGKQQDDIACHGVVAGGQCQQRGRILCENCSLPLGGCRAVYSPGVAWQWRPQLLALAVQHAQLPAQPGQLVTCV